MMFTMMQTLTYHDDDDDDINYDEGDGDNVDGNDKYDE